ncbi:F-box protein [Vigna angularis]|uniref:F-box protein n=1 Tax=Phaseolus angularis TaxID=3914 RepID=A0A8T0JH87_PHAAN|nr:F-box protein [Vigna angularis]
MPKCINNCHNLEGFWKNWHASFNKWLVRYIYIPLGGSKKKLLNVWVIFTFVAIWHDLEWKLLSWAWLTCIFFIPELKVLLEYAYFVNSVLLLGQSQLLASCINVELKLHAMVTRKCAKVDARVVCVESPRVVLLVDVYLPIQVWSGWQFPRSGAVAAAIFRHLSCDWDERSSMLSYPDYCRKTHGANESNWNLSDCHVLCCKLHPHVSSSSRKSLFELHELFKTLPGVGKQRMFNSSKIIPMDHSCRWGIWELSDDILTKILSSLDPMDLTRVSETCHHLRSLAASVMPCTKLNLFPHQLTAVEWMLHRERNAELSPHPLYAFLSTEDGFNFHVNTVSGEIVTGEAPTIRDFRGGMFCDEPGLGKTVTALSLIMKTRGTLADPPDEAQVVWCQHNGNQKCGYYEISGNNITGCSALGKRNVSQYISRTNDNHEYSSKKARMSNPDQHMIKLQSSCSMEVNKSPVEARFKESMHSNQYTRSLSRIKKNLCFTNEEEAIISKERETEGLIKANHASDVTPHLSQKKLPGKPEGDPFEYSDTWIQCDACHKWRKLADNSMASSSAAWFCSMNPDPLYQSCSVPEQHFRSTSRITYLPGFHLKGTHGGDRQNVSFFTSVLKEHYSLINSQTKKALAWLAKISTDKLAAMETNGIRGPILNTCTASGRHFNAFHKVFQAFGLLKRVDKGVCKWFYPQHLNNLTFDVAALGMALREPIDFVRLYLSRATLVVVPANLVDHWKTQIEKHVRPGQLRIYVWTDHRKPSVHCLAWDYDIVITTFSRLSAEWGPRKRSVLMQVHWFRVILDEGHTLGSSLNLTNKLQMAISLIASNRWILTGTPTPNTPNSQLPHLQTLLRFLHEESYGLNQKSWEAGVLRPFEAEMEEGRSRLLDLLHKCMISARKTDLQSIPPCIKKVVYLDFNEEHARSYNELVITVRRNILMADWNDPSHVESLLNPKQWKFRRATIKNVRLSCCVAGHIKVTHAGEDIQETMDMLVQSGLDPTSGEYTSIRCNLLYGGHCVRCKEWCRLPVITPCRHLLCLDCVSIDHTKCTCPGCSKLYEMQSRLPRPENPNPKWPVPKDLIELQPSYKQACIYMSSNSSCMALLMDGTMAMHKEQVISRAHRMGASRPIHVETLAMHGTIEEQMLGFLQVNLYKFKQISQFLLAMSVEEQKCLEGMIKNVAETGPLPLGKKLSIETKICETKGNMSYMMNFSVAISFYLIRINNVFNVETILFRIESNYIISSLILDGFIRNVHLSNLAVDDTLEEQTSYIFGSLVELDMIVQMAIVSIFHLGRATHPNLLDISDGQLECWLRDIMRCLYCM